MVPQHGPFSLHIMRESQTLHKTTFPNTGGMAFG
jgi:hypothetical protein